MPLHLEIEKLVYGGDGLGHCDGQTVFVPFVLPEEIVQVTPLERKKKFVRARIEQVVQPSPERAAAPCPHFGICGGCNYQHIPYEAQLRFKAEILRETLRRIGRMEWTGEILLHPSPAFGYRNRAQWKARPAGDRVSLGYMQAGTSSLVRVDACPILSPRLEETLAALRVLGKAGELPATLREIEAFADSADERVLLNVSLTEFGAGPATLAEKLRSAVPHAESILLHESSRDRFELFGPGFINYVVADTSYRVGHLSFFQVNRHLLEPMVRAVTANETGRLALDLFAGVGLFTVPLTRCFESVVAVESNAAAARDLEVNLEASGAAARVVHTAVEEFLKDFAEKPDLVVLDPPRAGVPPEALAALAALRPERITYLSCDPATLARDLRALVGTAYRIAEIHFFDVFPQTYHIESLVRLERVE